MNTDKMAAVALTKDQHKVFTQRWRDAIPYGTNYKAISFAEVLKIAKEKVYHDAPELYEAMLVDLAAGLKKIK